MFVDPLSEDCAGRFARILRYRNAGTKMFSRLMRKELCNGKLSRTATESRRMRILAREIRVLVR
jgi:hypothetical protein